MDGNYAPHIYNEYKTRNILSLAERVEVIREYDRHLTRPSLQSLAQRFECSSKQIKNILINRESILESFRAGEAGGGGGGGGGGQQKEPYNNTGDLWQKRQEKIAFLGKVMYEYIQRILYFNQSIDDQKFRQKALQIKECIAVENFQPTNAWLDYFKSTYGIPAFDLQSLRNNIVLTEAKRPHLSAIDMIQYVSRMEQESGGKMSANRPNITEHFPKVDTLANGHFNAPKNHASLEPKIIYEIEDEEDEELKKLNCVDAMPKAAVQNDKPAVKRRTASPFPDIESIDDAMKHVKALEEYAMLHDNFRAIGLLTQLEQILQKKDKKE